MSSFFLLEKAKCLVQKYRNRFHWKCLIETTETLECKALKNQSATFFFNLGKISFNMATLIFTLLIRVLQGTASVVC